MSYCECERDKPATVLYGRKAKCGMCSKILNPDDWKTPAKPKKAIDPQGIIDLIIKGSREFYQSSGRRPTKIFLQPGMIPLLEEELRKRFCFIDARGGRLSKIYGMDIIELPFQLTYFGITKDTLPISFD